MKELVGPQGKDNRLVALIKLWKWVRSLLGLSCSFGIAPAAGPPLWSGSPVIPHLSQMKDTPTYPLDELVIKGSVVQFARLLVRLQAKNRAQRALVSYNG